MSRVHPAGHCDYLSDEKYIKDCCPRQSDTLGELSRPNQQIPDFDPLAISARGVV